MNWDLIVILLIVLLYAGLLVFACVYSFHLGYKAGSKEPLIETHKINIFNDLLEEEEKDAKASPIEV